MTIVVAAILALATSVAAQGVYPGFTPGRCSFDAVAYQGCENTEVNNLVEFESFYDGAGKQFIERISYIELSDGQRVMSEVVGKELNIGFESGTVHFDYDGTHWPNKDNKSKFTCTIKPSEGIPLNCEANDHLYRPEPIRCEFDCAMPELKQTMKRTRHEPLPEILSAPPSSLASGSTTTANYAPGYCSFKMQLLQQCLHTSSEGWHSQMLGMLFSIQDNNRVTVATYPEGTGRIDDRAVRLTGIGGLKVAYNSQDKQAYFAFEPKGGWWSTATNDAPGIKGLCHWDPWTRNEVECSETTTNDHPRLSDMTCIFQC